MSKLIQNLNNAPVLADGAMGSYLFRRTGRLSERNHVYESLSIDAPELIGEIHTAYLRAGAKCLTTNTFGANREMLHRLGETRPPSQICRASVAVARDAARRFSELRQVENDVFLLGSIGPAMEGKLSRSDVEVAHAEQVDNLVNAQIDALLLETFTSLEQLIPVAELCIERSGRTIPIIAEMSLQKNSSGSTWSTDPIEYVREVRRLGIEVFGINCCAPWDALAFLDEVDQMGPDLRDGLLISVMPNAGGFQRIGNRFMTRVNSEFMGQLARTLARRGVRLIGGCCEVHPSHVREMSNFLSSTHVSALPVEVFEPTDRPSATAEEKKRNGPFSDKLLSGQFAVSVEVVPPRGTSAQVLNSKISLIDALSQSGLADAVDLTDGSRGIPLMPAGDFVTTIREHLGWSVRTGDLLEFIPHFTCRDLNTMGMQSRLIGFHNQRIHNVLFITGDPPKMSPTYPRSTAVFDADSAGMIRFTSRFLNAGTDFGGQPLSRLGDPRTHFTVGSGFEPEALDLGREQEKLHSKIENGADYVMTQPAFRLEALDILNDFRKRIPILAGVMILTGLDHAQRVGQIPGVVIPQGLLDRFARFPDPKDQARLGIEVAVEQVQKVKSEGWAGLYLMSPGSLSPILDVLQQGLGR
jgi:homocysteine S-methyltransferase